MNRQPAPPKVRIGVCGLQEKGCEIPDGDTLRLENFELTFVPVGSPKNSLEDFDGVVIASGAFERITERSSYLEGVFYDIEYNQPALLRREREVNNLLGKGGWVCALVDEVVDLVTDANYSTQDLSEIDLTKKLLNGLGIRRNPIAGGASVLDCKSDEFKAYFKRHAAAHTTFSYYDQDFKKLATFGDHAVVAVACNNSCFFLPFHFATHSIQQVMDALESAIAGVLNYRAKNQIVLPSWLDEIEFDEERVLAAQIEDLKTRLIETDQKATELKIRKSILTTSGEILVEQVDKTLREFFGLKTEAVEKRIEDLKIVEKSSNTILSAVEVKGVNSGVKREHINQVDSHRERLGLSGETPGLLIINDNAKIEGVVSRWQIEVDKEQVKHAARNNVTILRTVDLLLFMKAVEDASSEARGTSLLDRISGGGGWLRMVEGELVLINS